MAITAIGELLMDAARMRRTVTIGTFGHHFVALGMAGHAGNIFMLVGTGHKQLIGGLVAGGAVSVGRFRAISHGSRHMCLMADTTVGLGLLRRMGLMTFDALGNHAMLVGMTETACEQRMLARVGIQLRLLRIVAGETGRGHISGQSDFQRPMRVVATGAVRQLIMGFAFMTHAALGNIIRDLRRMTDVAILTGNGRLMLGPGGGDVSRLLVMTLNAVAAGQSGILRRRIARKKQQGQSTKDQQFTTKTLLHRTSLSTTP